MPRLPSFIVGVLLSLAMFFFNVVVPGLFPQAAQPVNYARFYAPILFLPVVPSIFALLDYMFYASIHKWSALVRGWTIYILVLVMFCSLIFCVGMFGVFNTANFGPNDATFIAVLSRSDDAFWATVWMISGVMIAIAGYTLLLQLREAHMARTK